MGMRIGVGYDVHRLVAGRPLIIGGVRIEHALGLDGHSDADVLLHAICDALLGAACLGDIGLHFPDTSAEFAGADSLELLRRTGALVREEGYRPSNVDSVIAIEKPRLRPYVDSMRDRISSALDLDIGAVSIKATTAEGLGIVGREEGAAAWACCMLTFIDDGTR